MNDAINTAWMLLLFASTLLLLLAIWNLHQIYHETKVKP